MAKIDEVIAGSVVGHDHYVLYAKQKEATELAQNELEFRLARVTVCFKCDWERVRVFIGSAEFNREDAVALAKGILERLTDLTFDTEGSE